MSTPDEILAAHYAANPHVAAQLQVQTNQDKADNLQAAADGALQTAASLQQANEDGPAIHVYEPAEAGLSHAALNRILAYTQSVVDEARVPHGSESTNTLCAEPTRAMLRRSYMHVTLIARFTSA
jgi:hypothetical protein